jgi:hypothetical protein
MSVMVAIAIGTSVSNAQNKETRGVTICDWDVYYSTVDPGNTALGLAPWTLVPGVPNIAVSNNQTIWFGVENQDIPELYKRAWLTIGGAGVGAGFFFSGDSVEAYHPGGSSTGIEIITPRKKQADANTATFNVHINPQPEWEVFELRNTSGTPKTITSVDGCSNCDVRPAPSLSLIGLTVLIALLLASTIYILSRRRKGVTQA